MWGLKKKVDELQALLLDRSNSLEDALKIIISRGEVVEILKAEIELLREERKQMLDRLMARDFETLQTYTMSREEKIEEGIRPEEDDRMAGEIFSVPKT